ncbi:hypothetical protein RV09_GL002867 [Enterococcus moraviensis]|nr:hypothetical protein RV09_GL002867 [Enterococcus moraviensis]
MKPHFKGVGDKMKNSLKGLFLVAISIFLASCSAKKMPTEESKNEIDQQLVESLPGSWVANSYDYGNYEISYEDKKLCFNSEELEIEYTEENRVFTHQEKDKSFHYIFEVNKDGITVLPHYEVKQTGKELITGGDLAPIMLKKQRILTKENLLGRWKSVEPDHPGYFEIKATFDSTKIDVLLSETAEFKEVETIPLTAEKGNSALVYIDESKTTKYIFTKHEEAQIILNTSSTQTGAEGTARPWILERVINE